MRNLLTLSLLALPILLAGCMDPNKPLNATFGEAHRNNMAAQIVDPEPNEGTVVADGNNAAAATERYRSDQVKQPDAERTSELGSEG